MANFIFTIGVTGRTYTTLQAAWNALPSPVPAGDTYFLTLAAGLYTSGLDCDSAAKTLSGKVVVMPEAGAEWGPAFTSANAPFRYDNTKGVAIEATPFVTPLIRGQTNLAVRGIQLKGGGIYGAIGSSGNWLGMEVSGCIINCDATNTKAFKTAATSGDVSNNLIVTSFNGPPIEINDTNGYIVNFVGNTVIKPDGGGGVLNAGQYGNGLRFKDTAVFGFSGVDAARIDAANSSNNATDLATFPGSSNLVSLTASSQFTDATYATRNLLLATGSALIGAGVTNALITNDAYGNARTTPPSIGAAKYGSGIGAAPSTINLAISNLTTAATLSTGAATVTPPVAGVTNLLISNLASAATLSTGAATVTPVQGTITSDVFTAYGSPAPLAALNVPHVSVVRMTDRVQVLNLANQVTNGVGRLVLTSQAIVSGIWYMLATWNADGSLRGFKAHLAA